jgi:uncharacterized membrane protein YraQ (UPF0718 family)
MLLTWLTECWELFWDSAIYVLFGIGVAGLIRAFISPSSVANHLGKGRVGPVFKAALWGIPLPLCSCGVLPAAAGLRKQGATTGATTSFLISTPESGVDSIAVSYAMLDPLLTIARPLAGFITAIGAGLADTFIKRGGPEQEIVPDLSCPVDGCCDGKGCPDEVHRKHHTRAEKLKAGMKYSFGELWGDLAGWFFIGMLLAGLITALLPPDVFSSYLGGGLGTMLIMLAVGIPIYICATSSTPIAAALILKGVSPGAALVFLLAGPATNITSLTVLFGLLGKRSTAIYLSSIALMAVLCGLALDWLYGALGIDPRAVLGQAGELVPHWLKWAGAVTLLAISIRPLYLQIRWLLSKKGRGHEHHGHGHDGHDPQAAPKAPASCAGST